MKVYKISFPPLFAPPLAPQSQRGCRGTAPSELREGAVRTRQAQLADLPEARRGASEGFGRTSRVPQGVSALYGPPRGLYGAPRT